MQWHMEKFPKLKQYNQHGKNPRVFGITQIKNTNNTPLTQSTQKRLNIDELATYHVYEIFQHEGYQANIHKMDMSMPFGLSLFPSLSECNKIN